MRRATGMIGFCSAIFFLATLGSAGGEEPAKDSLLGKSVLLKETAQPQIGNKRLAWNSVPLPGKVKEIKGDWLWLGTAWVRRGDVLTLDEAPAYFTDLSRRIPNSAAPYALRGVCWQLRGEYKNALKDFNEACRLEPTNASFFECRGKAHYCLHQYDEAIDDFTESIRLDPSGLVAYNDRGAAWNAMGEFERARGQFNEVLRKEPDNALAHCNLGVNCFERGEYQKALDELNESIRLNPEMAAAYCNRGNVSAKLGDYPQALEDYMKAVEIAPDDWTGYYGWARIKATSPESQLRDGAKAKELALKACEMSHWSEWSPLAALAAACAEMGDFEEAVKWQTQATELSLLSKREKHQAENKKRLALYKAGKPFYEETIELKKAEPLKADEPK